MTKRMEDVERQRYFSAIGADYTHVPSAMEVCSDD